MAYGEIVLHIYNRVCTAYVRSGLSKRSGFVELVCSRETGELGDPVRSLFFRIASDPTSQPPSFAMIEKTMRKTAPRTAGEITHAELLVNSLCSFISSAFCSFRAKPTAARKAGV